VTVVLNKVDRVSNKEGLLLQIEAYRGALGDQMVAAVPIGLPSTAVVSFLYADSGAGGRSTPLDARMENLRAAMSQALENILLHARGGR